MISSLAYPRNCPALKTQWISMRVTELGPSVPSLLTAINVSGVSISGAISVSGGISISGYEGTDIAGSIAYRSKMDYSSSGNQSITYIVGGTTETTLATAT